MDEKFKFLISEALELDISEVNENLTLDPEENWDSIALLSVISAIDTQYGIQLDGDKLANCSSISKLYKLIGKYLS
jgi:acyl carrier protein